MSNKPRLVVIGAGLCGSVLAMRLRNAYAVTVVEQSAHRHPLLGDIDCPTGGVASTINRGAGLGGTTNYWHNALIELDRDDLLASGIDPDEFAPYYARAWQLFMSAAEIAATRAIGERNAAASPGRGATAHMVVPHARVNLWQQADRAFPGDPVRVVYGHANSIVPASNGVAGTVLVRSDKGDESLPADCVIVAAGGLATPAVLAAARGQTDVTYGGYHDHPMAYVAKVRLKPDSVLKSISCYETGPASVRAGFVYQARDLKSVFYLRPARSLDVRSITGEARYILSDLRNDPFSPRKIWQLLMNLEALREAILFKTKAGFVGDYYSVLMLGEQEPLAERGVRIRPERLPALDWRVTAAEHEAYQDGFEQFLVDMAAEIVDRKVIPPAQWDYRTAAHHSGTASDALDPSAGGLDFFAVDALPGVYVCDGSLLRRGGVANSGLTLVALCHQLADSLAAA
ncbi:MAG TPA: hypothetical protein VGM77_06515 [Gemmatimonadales bacterium]|jgi:hypothetical protein